MMTSVPSQTSKARAVSMASRWRAAAPRRASSRTGSTRAASRRTRKSPTTAPAAHGHRRRTYRRYEGAHTSTANAAALLLRRPVRIGAQLPRAPLLRQRPPSAAAASLPPTPPPPPRAAHLHTEWDKARSGEAQVIARVRFDSSVSTKGPPHWVLVRVRA